VAVVSALEYGPKRSGRCREPRAAAGGAGECPSSTTWHSLEEKKAAAEGADAFRRQQQRVPFSSSSSLSAAGLWRPIARESPANGWRYSLLACFSIRSCCCCCYRCSPALLLLVQQMANGSVAASFPCCSLPSILCTRCYYCCCCYCCCPYCPPLPPPLALVPTKGQPLKGRVPPGLGLSPLWTPNAAAHMENDDDE
jgi:hypothetical protein